MEVDQAESKSRLVRTIAIVFQSRKTCLIFNPAVTGFSQMLWSQTSEEVRSCSLRLAARPLTVSR